MLSVKTAQQEDTLSQDPPLAQYVLKELPHQQLVHRNALLAQQVSKQTQEWVVKIVLQDNTLLLWDSLVLSALLERTLGRRVRQSALSATEGRIKV